MRAFMGLIALTFIALPVVAYETQSHQTDRTAVEAAIAEDQAVAIAAIEQLRGRGPEGLQDLFEAYGDDLKKMGAAADRDTDPRWVRIRHAIDKVAGQRDAHASGLYWYQDFDDAKRAAAAAGKPILSLRLLGRLDEQFSCANSRFFRTVLYANAEVNRHLREHFVLHWKSVRPVPKITIDFGDGRFLQRTITGNSIHYVLDSAGRPVDAIPGLYGPKVFLAKIRTAEKFAVRWQPRNGQQQDAEYLARQYDKALRDYHSRRLFELAKSWADDLRTIGETEAPLLELASADAKDGVPSALDAAPVAMSKWDVEMPILSRIMTIDATLAAQSDGTDDQTWQKIARLHDDEAALDTTSVALMRAQLPAIDASRVAMTKTVLEDPLLRVVANFQRSVAEDTVRNEYLIHSRIHRWFVDAEEATAEVDQLNKRVYAELFLTPDEDPWLGLVATDTYSALLGDGIGTRTEVQ